MIQFGNDKIKKVSFGLQKIKEIYYGNDLVWKWIRKLEYYGVTTPLSSARRYLAATSIGDYALFGGGYVSTISPVVDAYNTSLVRSTPTPLSSARRYLAATSIGDYALFGGGDLKSNNVVDAYNSTLVRSTPTPLSSVRYGLAATTIGDYALFGGGASIDHNTHTINTSNVVDAYNTSLVRSTPTRLSSARENLAATSIGDYALFGGGAERDDALSRVVDAYNTSLVRSTPTPLSSARMLLAATSIGDYALFGGGYLNSNVVDAYNTSLVRSTPTRLSSARHGLAATTIGDYAIFGGGASWDDDSWNTNSSNAVDAYNTSLVRSTPTPLSSARMYLAATSIGDYAIFGGGAERINAPSGVVDVYQLV